jgi:hypothetical protein
MKKLIFLFSSFGLIGILFAGCGAKSEGIKKCESHIGAITAIFAAQNKATEKEANDGKVQMCADYKGGTNEEEWKRWFGDVGSPRLDEWSKNLK